MLKENFSLSLRGGKNRTCFSSASTGFSTAERGVSKMWKFERRCGLEAPGFMNAESGRVRLKLNDSRGNGGKLVGGVS
jgi:hypothetical protein